MGRWIEDHPAGFWTLILPFLIVFGLFGVGIGLSAVL